MKRFIVLTTLITISLAYTDLDDSYDFGGLFKNPDEMRSNVLCLIGKGPCSEVMLHYRDHTFEAINDGCNECNNIETHALKVFLDGLKNYPDLYEDYRKTYDRDGSHFGPLLEKLKKY